MPDFPLSDGPLPRTGPSVGRPPDVPWLLSDSDMLHVSWDVNPRAVLRLGGFRAEAFHITWGVSVAGTAARATRGSLGVILWVTDRSV